MNEIRQQRMDGFDAGLSFLAVDGVMITIHRAVTTESMQHDIICIGRIAVGGSRARSQLKQVRLTRLTD
jgi:hypothetical protein